MTKQRTLQTHAEDIEMKAREMMKMKVKFDEHNLLQKEKNELKCEHLNFLYRQAHGGERATQVRRHNEPVGNSSS